MKDKLFQTQKGERPFAFTKEVADVFDDMASRSIPLYEAVQKELVAIIGSLTSGVDGAVLDVGCSTGHTLSLLRGVVNSQLIGIDSCSEMIEKAAVKLKGLNDISLLSTDIRQYSPPKLCSALFHFVLQFLPTSDRVSVLRTVFRAMSPGALVIVSEKTSDEALDKVYKELYWNMKRRNGYSEEEIIRKHNALEGVLVPLSISKNISNLKEAGFVDVAEIFRGYQFVTIMGRKDLNYEFI